jgi:hypothetical protein
VLAPPAIEEDLSAPKRTSLDNDRPSKQWFCIHHQSAHIAKPMSGTYVSYVKDHQKESQFFKPNVIILPQRMYSILKPLLYNNKLFIFS